MAQKRTQPQNRYQLAVDVLQKGREVLLRDLTEEILYHSEDFEEGGFLFQEFLENQGTKLHFLYLMLSQLEQSAEAYEATLRRTRISSKKTSRSRKSEFQDPLEDCPTDTDEPVVFPEADAPPETRRATARRPRKVRAQSSVPSPTDDGE
jgi:hypothetical protein